MASILMEEYELSSDSKYRSYTTAIDKALRGFDSTTEWADLIAALGKIIKVIEYYSKYAIIPRRVILSKRLAQCMHPALPSGVHLKALKTYDIIFKCMGTDRLAQELFLYSAGLFPLFSHAAVGVRSGLLDIYETHFVALGGRIRPALNGFLCGILPGLEEGSEHQERVEALFNVLCLSNGPLVFYEVLWKCVRINPTIRLPAIEFIVSRCTSNKDDRSTLDSTSLDSRNSKLTLISNIFLQSTNNAVSSPQPFSETLVHALCNCVQDTSVLVQRRALDLINLSVPIHRWCIITEHSTNIFNDKGIASNMDLVNVDSDQLERYTQLVKIVSACLHVLLRRDMSLNRRLFNWLLGNDHHHMCVDQLKRNQPLVHHSQRPLSSVSTSRTSSHRRNKNCQAARAHHSSGDDEEEGEGGETTTITDTSDTDESDKTNGEMDHRSSNSGDSRPASSLSTTSSSYSPPHSYYLNVYTKPLVIHSLRHVLFATEMREVRSVMRILTSLLDRKEFGEGGGASITNDDYSNDGGIDGVVERGCYLLRSVFPDLLRSVYHIFHETSKTTGGESTDTCERLSQRNKKDDLNAEVIKQTNLFLNTVGGDFIWPFLEKEIIEAGIHYESRIPSDDFTIVSKCVQLSSNFHSPDLTLSEICTLTTFVIRDLSYLSSASIGGGGVSNAFTSFLSTIFGCVVSSMNASIGLISSRDLKVCFELLHTVLVNLETPHDTSKDEEIMRTREDDGPPRFSLSECCSMFQMFVAEYTKLYIFDMKSDDLHKMINSLTRHSHSTSQQTLISVISESSKANLNFKRFDKSHQNDVSGVINEICDILVELSSIPLIVSNITTNHHPPHTDQKLTEDKPEIGDCLFSLICCASYMSDDDVEEKLTLKYMATLVQLVSLKLSALDVEQSRLAQRASIQSSTASSPDSPTDSQVVTFDVIVNPLISKSECHWIVHSSFVLHVITSHLWLNMTYDALSHTRVFLLNGIRTLIPHASSSLSPHSSNLSSPLCDELEGILFKVCSTEDAFKSFSLFWKLSQELIYARNSGVNVDRKLSFDPSKTSSCVNASATLISPHISSSFDTSLCKMLDCLSSSSTVSSAVSRDWLISSLVRGDISQILQPIVVKLLHKSSCKRGIIHIDVLCRKQKSSLTSETHQFFQLSTSDDKFSHLIRHQSSEDDLWAISLEHDIFVDEIEYENAATHHVDQVETKVYLNNALDELSITLNPFSLLVDHEKVETTANEFEKTSPDSVSIRSGGVSSQSLDSDHRSHVIDIVKDILNDVLDKVADLTNRVSWKGRNVDSNRIPTNLRETSQSEVSYKQKIEPSMKIISNAEHAAFIERSHILLYRQSNVVDCSQILHNFNRIECIINTSPSLFVKCLVSTFLIQSDVTSKTVTSTREKELESLLMSHRRFQLGKSFIPHVDNVGSPLGSTGCPSSSRKLSSSTVSLVSSNFGSGSERGMFQRATWLETLMTCCLDAMRCFLVCSPNFVISETFRTSDEIERKDQIFNNNQIQLKCVSILKSIISNLTDIILNKSKYNISPHYILNLLQRLKVQKLVLQSLWTMLRFLSEQDDSSDLNISSSVINQLLDDVILFNWGGSSDFIRTYQIEMLNLLHSLIALEDATSNAPNPTTTISPSSGKSPEKSSTSKTRSSTNSHINSTNKRIHSNNNLLQQSVFGSTWIKLGSALFNPTTTKDPTVSRYYPGRLIIHQPMFMWIVISALQPRLHQMNKSSMKTSDLFEMHLIWSSFFTSSMVYMDIPTLSLSSHTILSQISSNINFAVKHCVNLPPDYALNLIQSYTLIYHYCLFGSVKMRSSGGGVGSKVMFPQNFLFDNDCINFSGGVGFESDSRPKTGGGGMGSPSKSNKTDPNAAAGGVWSNISDVMLSVMSDAIETCLILWTSMPSEICGEKIGKRVLDFITPLLNSPHISLTTSAEKEGGGSANNNSDYGDDFVRSLAYLWRKLSREDRNGEDIMMGMYSNIESFETHCSSDQSSLIQFVTSIPSLRPSSLIEIITRLVSSSDNCIFSPISLLLPSSPVTQSPPQSHVAAATKEDLLEFLHAYISHSLQQREVGGGKAGGGGATNIDEWLSSTETKSNGELALSSHLAKLLTECTYRIESGGSGPSSLSSSATCSTYYGGDGVAPRCILLAMSIFHMFISRITLNGERCVSDVQPSTAKTYQDLTVRLVDVTLEIGSSCLEQTTWLRRTFCVNVALQKDILMRATTSRSLKVSARSSVKSSSGRSKSSNNKKGGNNSNEINSSHESHDPSLLSTDLILLNSSSTFDRKTLSLAMFAIQAINSLADCLAFLLDVVFSSEDKDKMVVVSSILSSVMETCMPYLKNGNPSNKKFLKASARLLSSLSEYQFTRRFWKRDVYELVLDPSFFQCQVQGDLQCFRFWRKTIDNLFTHDKVTFKELLAKLTAISQSSSLSIFTNRDAENEQRAMLIRRLAFVIYCSDVDQYPSDMPDIQERLAETLRLIPNSPSVRSAVFLCFRVILIRLSAKYVTSLWPLIITEIVQVFSDLELELISDSEEWGRHLGRLSHLDSNWVSSQLNSLQVHNSPQWLHLYLAVCKLIDLALAIPTLKLPQFQLYSWAFVGGIDKTWTNVSSNDEAVGVDSQFLPYVDRVARLLIKKIDSKKSVEDKEDANLGISWKSTHLRKFRTTSNHIPMLSMSTISDFEQLAPFFKSVCHIDDEVLDEIAGTADAIDDIVEEDDTKASDDDFIMKLIEQQIETDFLNCA